MSAFDLTGEVAVITGATRGIGQAMAVALATAGADVILVQRSSSNTETKAAIEALSRRVWIYEADMGDKESVQRVAEDILERDGHDVSILVPCAGIQRRAPSDSFPQKDFDEVNLTSVFQLCREFGRYMLKRTAADGRRKGSIINIASLLSFQGGITVPAYAAAKGGIAQLTKALSNEWASQGVNVNAIAPGYIATEMNTALLKDEARQAAILQRIPANRWGRPQDFAGPVVFLASMAADYISGEILTVDGGWMGR